MILVTRMPTTVLHGLNGSCETSTAGWRQSRNRSCYGCKISPTNSLHGNCLLGIGFWNRQVHNFKPCITRLQIDWLVIVGPKREHLGLIPAVPEAIHALTVAANFDRAKRPDLQLN